MSKFSINRNPKSKEPTDEQIRRHKDFSRLSANYDLLVKQNKKPLYKNKKLFLLLFLFAVILYLILFES